MGEAREKVSVTIPPSLVEDVDRAVKRRRYPSRSAAVVDALTRWARAERDSEWDEYYASASVGERREEHAWAELGYESFVRNARADHGVKPPRRRRTRR